MILSSSSLFSSIFYIILASFFAQFLRKFNKYIFEEFLISISTKKLFDEFIATAELTVDCYFLGFVEEKYGQLIYGICYLFVCLWWNLTWEDATASPNENVELWLEGEIGFSNVIYLTFAQILGGLFIWANLVRKLPECYSDIQVSIVQGAFVEGLGTLVCEFMSKICDKYNLKYSQFICAIISTFCVISGTNFTGGYYSPALVTSMKFSCLLENPGEIKEHFLIYWVGTTAASILTFYLFPVIFPSKIKNKELQIKIKTEAEMEKKIN